ncbi:unnamed protein product [Brassica napus]|uniref:(rape) hypothetical protein n=1 Tax=Brassica napus TaxID=3708 RepID=A0A816K5Q2_BRANA|nr:unnamed protein product [Brassica napus]
MQPQSGGKFRPRLNMGERPIANKYREGSRWGPAMRPGRMRNGAIRSVDRFGARHCLNRGLQHAPYCVPWHLRAQGVGLWLPIRPILKHGLRSLTCVRVNGLVNPTGIAG